MNHHVKKIICKFAAIAITVVSASAMTLPAFAAQYGNLGNPLYPSNFNNYSNTWYGSVSRLETDPYACLIASTNGDYSGRYKAVEYYVYKKTGPTSYSYYAGDANHGTSTSVACYPEFNQNSIAKKIYLGEIRQGTDSGANLKEDYFVDIRLS